MRSKRLLSLCGMLSLLTLITLGGCSSSDSSQQSAGGNDGKPKRLIILTNGPDPFWDTCEAGARAAEKELGLADQGYVVDFQRGDFSDKKQIDMLKQYVIDSDVAGVGISVLNPDNLNLVNEMRTLREKGVAVIAIDSDVNRQRFRDARYAYLGTDNVVGGRELGKAAQAISPEGAKYAFFVGDLGVANAVERMSGFVEGIGEADQYQELARLSDGGDSTRARKNVEDLLNQQPECNMLVGIWAYNTPQMVNVVKDRGIRDKTKVVCFDAAENSIAGMGTGNVDVMVVQNPYQMGYEGIGLMLAMANDNTEKVEAMFPTYSLSDENDIHRTELRVVVPDEGSPVTADLFEPETVFFTHSEFQEWLKERGLVSS